MSSIGIAVVLGVVILSSTNCSKLAKTIRSVFFSHYKYSIKIIIIIISAFKRRTLLRTDKFRVEFEFAFTECSLFLCNAQSATTIRSLFFIFFCSVSLDLMQKIFVFLFVLVGFRNICFTVSRWSKQTHFCKIPNPICVPLFPSPHSLVTLFRIFSRLLFDKFLPSLRI